MTAPVYDEPIPPRASTDPAEPDATPDAAPDLGDKGRWLAEPDKRKVTREIEKAWKAQDARMRPILAQWEANEYTMLGVPGVRATKEVDSDTWYARVPIGASAVRVGLSKARELADKTTATLFVDPAAPDCQPSPDDDGDRAKAELCTRILKNELLESGLNLNQKLEEASDLGATYGSGFLVIEMDPGGAGWRPLAVNAHPAATHYDPSNPDALLQPPEGFEDDGLPVEPVQKYVGRRPPTPEPTATARWYADATGEVVPTDAGDAGPLPLVDDPEQADRQWQIKLRGRVTTGRQIRFLPLTARGIEEADAVLLADVTTFGTLRGMFPEIDGWSKERQGKLMHWRPVELRQVLPPGLVVDGDGKATVEGEGDPREGLPADDALCMTLSFIARSHPAYPDGALVLCAGETVLYRDTRCVWVGEGAEKRAECLDIHVVQVRRRTDPTGANPYGIADAELLAPGDDLRAELQAAAIEALWRANNPNVFVPYGSVVQAGALGVRDGTPLTYNPGAGQPVVYEQAPGMDPNTMGLYELVGREMDGRSGLEDAQRLNSPNITSGKQANVVMEQALTILSPMNRNAKNAFARACRIILQQFRAFATQPMLLRYTGDDGRYVVREFVNTDLGSARDVRIAAGTSTMLSQTAKLTLAAQDFESALKAGDIEGGYRRYRLALASNLDPQLGRDQDPHHHRVLRQIHAWREGPPAGEELPPAPPPAPLPQPMTVPGIAAPGDYVVNADQPPPPPDPMQTPDPRALALFQPVASDAQPDVAKTRALALADELARETTEKMPRPWVLALEAAYDKARRDAGIMFAAEQAAMQQQQQQAQAAQQSQEVAVRREEADAGRAFKAQEGEANRAAAAERATMQAASRGGIAA